MLGLEMEHSAIDKMAAALNATDDHIESAIARSLNRFRSEVFEKRVKQQVAAKERMPQYAIADRFFSDAVKPGDDELKMWVGTWAVEPFSMGTPSQTASGVSAGKRSYPGAFIAKIYTGTDKVWIRLHSTHYSPELYPTKYRPGDRGLIDYSNRFPVVKAAVPIDGTVEAVIDQEGASLAKEFEAILAEELSKEVTNGAVN